MHANGLQVIVLFGFGLLLNSCGLTKRTYDSCGYELRHEITRSNPRKIYYGVSSRMYNATDKKTEATPCVILTKIKKSFELWESVEDVNLQFEYVGTYDSEKDLSAYKPLIYMDLTGDGSFNSGVAGVGGIRGTAGGDAYQGGSVRINTKANVAGLGFKTLTHEIGHALGLSHSAHNGSLMSCGTPAWDEYDVLALNTQDRVDLTAVWNPGALYSISGQVLNSDGSAATHSYVYAVHTSTGITFSRLTNSDGTYTISVPTSFVTPTNPGNFRVFAKSYEATAWNNENVTTLPSWRIDNTTSTNDPYAGATLALSSSTTSQSNINITLLTGSISPLFWSTPYKIFTRTFPSETLFDCQQSFMRPGQSCKFYFSYLSETPQAITNYGSGADYSLSGLRTARNYENNATLDHAWEIVASISSTATKGDRLILAVFPGGIQAGLAGLHVNGATGPSDAGYFNVTEQIQNNWNFSAFDAFYWNK